MNAIDFGVVRYLRFWCDADPLPDGSPRCQHRYSDVDEWGWTEVRCARPAVKRVRICPPNKPPFEALLCSRCAERAQADEDLESVGIVDARTSDAKCRLARFEPK
jgi:hypothetical protein